MAVTCAILLFSHHQVKALLSNIFGYHAIPVPCAWHLTLLLLYCHVTLLLLYYTFSVSEIVDCSLAYIWNK